MAISWATFFICSFDTFLKYCNASTINMTTAIFMDGKNRNPINKFSAGDIGTTLKLKDTQTNQTLCAPGKEIIFDPIHFPESRIRVAIEAKNQSDDEKLGAVLSEIHQEDPTLTIEFSRELKQIILSAQGELHLNVTKWRLDKIYHLDVEFTQPRIPYRETIQKLSAAASKNKAVVQASL